MFIQGLLWFHINVRIFFQFCEECLLDFDENRIKCVDYLGSYSHFYSMISASEHQRPFI